jgi:hypothetical protein
MSESEMRIMVVNSVNINAASDLMWKWEQSGRRACDGHLREEALKHISEYCKMHEFPAWVGQLLFDTIMVTVRIANGFPPNTAVVEY